LTKGAAGGKNWREKQGRRSDEEELGAKPGDLAICEELTIGSGETEAGLVQGKSQSEPDTEEANDSPTVRRGKRDSGQRKCKAAAQDVPLRPGLARSAWPRIVPR
jgi:hypothetical protein